MAAACAAGIEGGVDGTLRPDNGRDVALLASWSPARRAARLHPVEALRYEA